MPRYRALVAYDGTAYVGFQRQRPGHITIQGELERVISQLAQHPTTIIGAGRTDSGVHALGQTICFDMDWRHSSQALENAINVNLPADIAVYQLSHAAPTFHPRYDARRRAYRYVIYNEPVRQPLLRHYSWHVKRPLDVEAMNEAAALLPGVQDFATFGRPPQGNNTVRELFTAFWQREEPLLVFTIEANAFLYRMVRSIVGSLKAVGEGRWRVTDFQEALAAADRSRCAAVAPPQGLTLASVTYTE